MEAQLLGRKLKTKTIEDLPPDCCSLNLTGCYSSEWPEVFDRIAQRPIKSFIMGFYVAQPDITQCLYRLDKSLEQLELRSFRLITNEQIDRLALLVNLRRLSISFSGISDISAPRLLENMPKLVSLTLNRNMLTDNFIFCLNTCTPSLTQLSLQSNYITCIGMIQIARRLHKIRELRLANNNIADQGAIYYLSTMQNKQRKVDLCKSFNQAANNRISRIAFTIGKRLGIDVIYGLKS